MGGRVGRCGAPTCPNCREGEGEAAAAARPAGRRNAAAGAVRGAGASGSDVDDEEEENEGRLAVGGKPTALREGRPVEDIIPTPPADAVTAAPCGGS